MVPDSGLQLAVVIKALREVVAPAVDPANRLAMEQLHLSIATLGLVQQGLPLAHARARREMLNALALAEAVRTAGGGESLGATLGEAMAGARATLDDPRAGEGSLNDARRALLAQTEAAVAASAGTPVQQAVARAVVAASRAQFDLARAWCLGAGFETGTEGLPALDALLAE